MTTVGELRKIADRMTSNLVYQLDCSETDVLKIVFIDGSSINIKGDIDFSYTSKCKTPKVNVLPFKPKLMAIEPDYFEHFNVPTIDPDEWKRNFSKRVKKEYETEENILLYAPDILGCLRNAMSGIPFNNDGKNFPLPKKMYPYWAYDYTAHIWMIMIDDIKLLETLEREAR